MRKTTTEVIEISGKPMTFEITQCNAEEGGEAISRLVKLMGSGLTEVGVSSAEEEKLAAVGIGATLKNLSPEDFKWFIELFKRGTKVEGQPLSVSYGELFAGEYGAMLKWAYRCFEFNFSSFLGGIASIVPLDMLLSRDEQTSPTSKPQ